MLIFDPQTGPSQEQGLMRLTNDGALDTYPAWSPNGNAIMFCSTPVQTGGSNDIWSISPNGANLEQVTADVHLSGGLNNPAWLGNTGDLVVLDTNGVWEWMRLSLSANPPLPVVRSAYYGDSPYFNRLLIVPGGLSGISLASSPDGSRVAWTVRTTYGTCPSHTELRASPVNLLSDQTTTTDAGTMILSNDLYCFPGPNDGIIGISFSPDGSEVVVGAAPDPNYYGYDLYIYRLDGTLVQRLTQSGDGPNPVINWQPSWSKNNRIAFTSNSTGRFEIWTINPDGSNLTPVTTEGGSSPTWSPDGSRIAFASDRSGNSQLYSIPTGTAQIIPGPPLPPIGIGSPGGTGGANAGSTAAYSDPNYTTFQPPVAEPVSTGNGNYYYQHTDLAIPGRGLPLVFQRTYNALDNYAGPLGSSWTHCLNIILSQTAAGVATIRWGDGHGENFTLTEGVYVPQPGVFSALVANADGTFVLTQKNQTRYLFSATGTLTNIVDKNGNTISLTYSGGNLTQITDTVGRNLTLSYDGSNRIIQANDPIGRTVSFSYSAANDLAQVTDPASGVTQYAYDGSHHVTSITLPNGQTLLQNTYDAAGRVITQTNGRGFTTTFAYNTPSSGQTTITDARGNQTVHSYDSSLRITTITDALGGTVGYGYDANNDRTAVMNQNGKTTTFMYDANGNVTSIIDPLGNSSGFTYDAKSELLTATNPKGNATTFSYDSNGNLKSIHDALGDTTTFAYDGTGELGSKTDANGHMTTYGYDSSGNLIQITDALGDITTLGYDGIGRLTSLTDPNHHRATAAYDALSRLTTVSDPLGHQTQFAYDPVGNLLKITDANGHATAYAYDAVNNLVAVTDALGHVTQYAYDPNNNRATFTNAKGNATSYAYDAVNRLSTITDPLSFGTAYTYDPVGNVTAVKDANGKTNQFAYDALNRLLTIAYLDGKNVNYAYDADGNRTSMVDAHGTTGYVYDALDRLTSVTNPGGATVTYGHDPVGNRNSLTYPDGKLVNYTYDAVNRLAGVSDWLGRMTTYNFDSASNLLGIAYPNKAAMTFAYDSANRLTSVTNAIQGVPPVVITYALDAVGNRTKESVDGVATAFGYDALNELISARLGPLQTTWAYDMVGNRVTQTTPLGPINYTYDAGDRMLTAGLAKYTYDNNGNQVTKTSGKLTWTYTYDAANRLVQALGYGINSMFGYDGDGNRILQTNGPGSYSYLNDVATALPVVLNEQGPDGNITYAYGLGLIEEASSKFNYFYHYDGLGSVIGLTDPKGKPQAVYAYDPWGNSLLTLTDFVGTKNNFRFTGEALDPGTGLYFLRARYYDPSCGRFLSRDRLPGFATLPRSANAYAYALNLPTRLSDPSGLLTFAFGVSGSLAVGVGGIEATLLVVYDDKGNRGLTFEAGPPIGIGASADGIVVLTNDETIYQLPGRSLAITGSVPVGVEAEGSILLSTNLQYKGVAFGVGAGEGAPVSGSITTTSLIDVNAPWLNIFPSQPFLSWQQIQDIIDAAQPAIHVAK
jgi:RHS repeat-associated protein